MMVSAALRAHDSLVPRSPDGTAPGAALSVLAHVALVAALAYGVSWRSPTPQTISAELWAAVPQTAAPAAEPAPTPPATAAPPPSPAAPPPVAAPAAPVPDVQIAIEQARKEKARQAEAARAAQEKAQREQAAKQAKERAAIEKAAKDKALQAKAEAERRERAAEDARLAQQREDNLRRMMGQLGHAGAASRPTGGGAPGSRGQAAADAAPSATYAGKLVKAIKGNLIFDWRGPGNPAATVEVRSAPSGTIMGRTLVKSSGHKDWDEAILRAIDKTGQLPADTDGRVPAQLTITFRPVD